MESPFEQRLRQLISEYRVLKQANAAMDREVADQARTIRELESMCQRLRRQVDEMDKDRFVIKQLRDERKTIRKKLESALSRLNALEQELLS
ncbi:hypothetical protein SCOR_12560 [Sulfidibacter corallicola]|uniref:Cell division protein ZapB n=1 Tax=Sulfidibacter corallicola TaxID=2818388 RepID=A0A8A4TGI9_SULCO|nr:hypothetical protein [Sulfidibacter corallicola]QTD47838.1 hypothetical protein J3U87_19805 [Sulfidibacter corallicola]